MYGVQDNTIKFCFTNHLGIRIYSLIANIWRKYQRTLQKYILSLDKKEDDTDAQQHNLIFNVKLSQLKCH